MPPRLLSCLALFRMSNHWFMVIQQKPCYPDVCKLPDCFCSGTEIPGSLSVSSIPQIVFVSFDAFVSSAPFFFYETLFDVISRLPSSFHMNTLIVVRFKICTVNVTKSGTIRYLAYYPHHGGQTLPKKDRERKY